MDKQGNQAKHRHWNKDMNKQSMRRQETKPWTGNGTKTWTDKGEMTCMDKWIKTWADKGINIWTDKHRGDRQAVREIILRTMCGA